jgi:hypothetical protein
MWCYIRIWEAPIAKAEFDVMVRDGTARPSESPWSSALHIVPKKELRAGADKDVTPSSRRLRLNFHSHRGGSYVGASHGNLPHVVNFGDLDSVFFCSYAFVHYRQ